MMSVIEDSSSVREIVDRIEQFEHLVLLGESCEGVCLVRV